ncbi:MAG: hypothetical protein ACD_27C00050G0002 [uncultured bacterium]|nr:MAG: hypothetical protein ACD_27C00050G0002 [uncultured bacterium]
MTEFRKDNNERIEKPFLDIDQKGLLVHGIGSGSIDDLINVLTEGLKPRSAQVNPRGGFTVVPEFVSLSMVGSRGYTATSTAFLFGASESRFNSNLTVVIDPSYVRRHPYEFMAVGQCFAEESVVRSEYTDETDGLANGVKYQELADDKRGDVFPDEIVTRSVPAEAIVAVIAKDRMVERIQRELRKVFPDRMIFVYGSGLPKKN